MNTPTPRAREEIKCLRCEKTLKRKRKSGKCISCVRIGTTQSKSTRDKRAIKLMGNKNSLGCKHSLITRDRMRVSKIGIRSSFWKGDNVTYETLHGWIVRRYGKANMCENVHCKFVNPRRYEYALIKGKEYKKIRDNYMMLCPSCHRKYDLNIINIKTKNG